MAKKVKYTDIAEPNLFDPLIEGANESTKALHRLEKQFGDVLKASAKVAEGLDFSKLSAKELRTIEEALKRGKAAQEGLNETLTQRQKLEARLADVIAQRGTEEEQLREQIRQQRKENRQLARDAVQVTSEYEKQSKTLNTLRRQYKDLAAQNKENTKEAKDLLKQITTLDKRLKEIDDTVGQNQRSVGGYVRALGTLQNRFRALQGLAIVGILTNLVQLFKQNDDAADGFQKIMNQVTVRVTAFVNAIVNVTRQEGTTFLNFFQRLGPALEETSKEMEKVIEEFNKLVDADRAVRESTAKTEIALASRRKRAEALRQASDDNTKSLSFQREQLELFAEGQEKVNKLEISIAQQRFNAAKAREKAERDAGKVSTATLEQVAQATQALAEAQINAERERMDIAKRRREIESDEAELELDILIDAADARKTANERIIADETLNNQRRRELLQETERDLDNSFARQIAILEEFSGKAIDGEELLSITDTEELNRQVAALGLSERLQTRLLEVIRDRIAAQEDLREANRDLTESDRGLTESARLLEAQQAVLEAQTMRRGKLNKELFALEQERAQIEIDGLRARLENIDQGSAEYVATQARLNDLLIKQQEDRLKRQLQLEQQFQEASLALLDSFLQKQNEKRLDAIDKQIQASADRESELREAAKQGSEDAIDNLAFEQKKRAELERERERQVQRQARLELILATFQTFQSKVASGDPNPLVSTITDVEILRQFVNALPAFWEGAEHIGDALGAPQLPGKDGHIVRVDGSERVVPGHINQRLKGISNAELATLADISRLAPLRVSQDSQPVVLALEKVNQTIAGKPVYLGQDYDAKRKQTIDLIQRQNRLERRRRKSGGAYGG